ncbi:hypothetical protein [Microcoleus sp. herbarium2]|uniref:hypothetical protein n=1 Tax=Microcoleus sp. herbarium2 TaxID=3055433 RepID=UPI002FD4391D
MGQKTQPSVTSGGIGVTQEITNIGGIGVTGGVSVDITPLDFGIVIDPSENTISVTGGAEVPGGLIGISGGIEVDVNTGEITGGSIGGEVGGIGINLSNSKKGGIGVEFVVQIPGTPIELSLGFGFPKSKNNNNEPPTFPETPRPGVGSPAADVLPLLDNNCYYYIIGFQHGTAIRQTWDKPLKQVGPHPYFPLGTWGSDGKVILREGMPLGYLSPGHIMWHDYPSRPDRAGFKINDRDGFVQLSGSSTNSPAVITGGATAVSFAAGTTVYTISRGIYAKQWISDFVKSGGAWEFSVIETECPDKPRGSPPVPLTPVIKNPQSPNPNLETSFPNPPPRKQKMDNCCHDSMQLLREIKQFNREILRLLGRPVGPKGLLPMTGAPGFLGEKIKRTETPIKDGKNPKEIDISFPTIYQLLIYGLRQANDLDRALDPKSYQVPSGHIQNPKYSRDSEHSLKNNQQPNRDKSGEKREFEINEDSEAKMGGFLEQQQYMFEALKRLEYMFPSGEFKDFKIDKSLIAPGKTGDMQIHNNFQTLEVLFQYLNSSLGDPREPIHIADTNPGKEGNQAITVTPFSLSHLMRETFKYIVDMEGDQDSQLNLALRDFRTNLANRVQIIQIAELVRALYEDSGMMEKQKYIKVKLEGDPYAGCYKEGKGFEPSKELDENTEEASEKLLEATLKNFEMKVKVSQRDNKKDPNDLRDLFIEMYNKLTEQQGGRAVDVNLVDEEFKKAKFNVELDGALERANMKKSQTASRYPTRKKKK